MDWKEKAKEEFGQLLDIMQTLRSDNGCPWDREQTLESLKRYLLEETYETLEAIDEDSAEHCEELGDLLLQIVFQSEIRRQNGQFDAADVCHSIVAKMKRRHPHIFGNEKADTSAQVVTKWEEIKARERAGAGNKKGTLGGVPNSMPQLLRAYKIGDKAARVGFDWPDTIGVWDKIYEEIDELKEAISEGDKAHVTHEIGDLMMALVNLSRHLDIEPEQALKLANDRFCRRFSYVEEQAAQTGRAMNETELQQLEDWWQEGKKKGL